MNHIETSFSEEDGDEVYDFIPLPNQKKLHDYEDLTDAEISEFEKKNLNVYYEEDDTHNIDIDGEEVNVIRKYFKVQVTEKGWTRVEFQKIKVHNKVYFVVNYDMQNYLTLETLEELFKYIEYKRSEEWFKGKTSQIKKKPKL